MKIEEQFPALSAIQAELKAAVHPALDEQERKEFEELKTLLDHWQATQWRPIETAPADGTEILATDGSSTWVLLRKCRLVQRRCLCGPNSLATRAQTAAGGPTMTNKEITKLALEDFLTRCEQGAFLYSHDKSLKEGFLLNHADAKRALDELNETNPNQKDQQP